MPRTIKDRHIYEIERRGTVYRLVCDTPDLSLGDVVLVRGTLRGLSETQDRLAASQGIVGTVTVGRKGEGVRRVKDGPAIYRLGLSWRNSFLSFTKQNLPAEVASLTDALCFNSDGDLAPDLRDDLQSTGTIHIVSASGLHVFLFSIVVQFLLSLFPIPRFGQFLALILVLMLYASAAGFHPPVVRAALMGIAFMGAEFVKRVPDSISSLSLVAMGFLFFEPLILLDVGFQLSFIAVFALSYFRLYEPTSDISLLPMLKRRLGHTLWLSFVATFATAPLVAYHFGYVSIVAVLANLLIAAAILPAMVGAVVGWVFSFAIPAISVGMLTVFVAPFVGWISAVVQWMSSIPFASISVPEFHPLWLLPVYAVPLILWRPRVRQA